MRAYLVLITLAFLISSTGCQDRGKSAPDQSPPAEAAGGDAGHLAVTGTVPLEISAVVAGKSVRASGLGECQFEPNGSIYDQPAALWSVTYFDSDAGDAGLQRFNLTMWRLKSGGAEQFSLALQVGETGHEISTVEGGERAGQGRGTAPRGGEGGRIQVEGESADGTKLAVTVDCPRFTGIEPAGG